MKMRPSERERRRLTKKTRRRIARDLYEMRPDDVEAVAKLVRVIRSAKPGLFVVEVA